MIKHSPRYGAFIGRQPHVPQACQKAGTESDSELSGVLLYALPIPRVPERQSFG